MDSRSSNNQLVQNREYDWVNRAYPKFRNNPNLIIYCTS